MKQRLYDFIPVKHLCVGMSLCGIVAGTQTAQASPVFGQSSGLELPSPSIYQQSTKQISGIVKDQAGIPVIGANVIVKGTTNGVITGLDGDFLLEVPENATLEISYIGYMTQSIPINGKTTFNIILEEDTQKLDEVVVLGYGAGQRKQDLSASVGVLNNTEDLVARPVTSTESMLQGQLAGVTVQANGGDPTATPSIVIRGQGSQNGDNVLWVVDGVPGAPIASMNDIETIVVLKDAASAAIYGAQSGAGGVILVTTKKAKEGKTSLSYDATFGVRKASNVIEPLNAEEQLEMRKLSYANAGLTLPTGWDLTKNPWVGTTRTNWMDEILQDALTQEYNLSVSGGNEKSNYAFSGNYTDQTGIIKNSGYERFAVRANIGSHVKPWLNTGLNINFTRSLTKFAKSNSYDYSIIRSAMLYLPTLYVGDKTEDDSYAWLSANPRTYVNTAKDELKSINVFTSAFAEIKILDCLKFRQNLGISYSVNDRASYYNRETGEGKTSNGRAGKSDNFWQNLTAESLVTFDKTFNKLHHLNVVAGFTYEKSDWGGKTMNASNFPTDITQDFDMSQALNIETPASYRGQAVLVSLLGRANYTFKDRYIFTASFRRDGSSRFAPGNKFANFASGAVAWTISEEEFIKNLNIFSNLKLRLSYGQTGNQAISSYQTIASLAPSNYPLDGTLSSGFAGQTYKGPLNDKLKWETTDQYNVGLDMGFWNNRISLSANYYYKKTNDLLQNVSIPNSTGYTTMWTNFGHVKNKGLELTGKIIALDKKDWSLDFDGNISFNKNEIGGLTADQYANQLWYSAKEVFLQRNGLPIGTIFGYIEDGFYDNIAEVRADPIYAKASDDEARRMIGEIKYLDKNNDGKITSEDRAIIGDTNPDFIYGLNANLRWKNLTLGLFFQGTHGNDIFNGNLTNIGMSSIANITQDAYDSRWTPENAANAKWPRVTTAMTRDMKLSDRYVEDGSYFRLKTINLNYNFGSVIKGINNLSVFGTVTNVFTITGYSWFDPDVNAFGSDASRRGVDIFSYPSSRTYSIGFKLTL